jgi:hypothetical protein
MADLRKRKPAVIFDTADIPIPQELAKFISRNYRYAGQVKYAKLYQLIGR